MIKYTKKGFMFELNQISENCYYIESPAKIGLIKTDENNICLIDSGNDKDAGRKIKQILDKNNWKLVNIYNTHSNADHIGGNKYLENNTGCKIFAPPVENAFTKYPVLEPSFLYGGFPFKEIKHKFLMAQESNAEELTPDNLIDSLEMIDLKGHFFNMTGFLHKKDNIAYIADSIFSKDIIDKYKLVFIYDVQNFLNTLEKLKNMRAKYFIPSHAPVTDNICDLADYNIKNVQFISETICEILKTPKTFENILKDLFNKFNLTMTPEQYILSGSSIKSFLSWLKDNNKINYYFENNKMYWATYNQAEY